MKYYHQGHLPLRKIGLFLHQFMINDCNQMREGGGGGGGGGGLRLNNPINSGGRDGDNACCAIVIEDQADLGWLCKRLHMQRKPKKRKASAITDFVINAVSRIFYAETLKLQRCIKRCGLYVLTLRGGTAHYSAPHIATTSIGRPPPPKSWIRHWTNSEKRWCSTHCCPIYVYVFGTLNDLWLMLPPSLLCIHIYYEQFFPAGIVSEKMDYLLKIEAVFTGT